MNSAQGAVCNVIAVSSVNFICQLYPLKEKLMMALIASIVSISSFSVITNVWSDEWGEWQGRVRSF